MMDDNNRWDKDFPEQWERVPLKSKFTFGKGLSIKKTDLTEQGENVISYGQIHAKWNSNVHCHNELLRHVPQTFCNGSDSSIAKRNGFIFADTSEDLDGVGNCAFIDSDKTIYAGYHTVLLTPIEDHDNKYLAYLFTTDTWRYQIRRHLTEVKVFSISQKTLKQTYIVLPPSDIQHAIASFLDRKCTAIDDSIAKHKAIIEKLEEYRKAEITRAVTKCEEFRKMKFLFDIYAGATPKSTIEEYWDGDIIWITPADFKTEDHFVSSGRRNLTDAGYHAANTTIVPEGSIIVSKRAPIGTVAITNVPLCTNQGCLSCVPKEYVSSKFYYYVMIAMNESMQVLGAGTTFQEISANSFANMKVPYCDYDEQLKIAEALDKVNVKIGNAIEQHNQLISKLKEYKKSLIYNAVTGKIDCREGA